MQAACLSGEGSYPGENGSTNSEQKNTEEGSQANHAIHIERRGSVCNGLGQIVGT